MPNGTAAGAAAVQAAIANAIKASGAIVKVDAEDFLTVMHKTDEPLVVYAATKVFKTSHQYMTAYRGFIFYTKTPEPLMLPNRALVINAKKIWIPA